MLINLAKKYLAFAKSVKIFFHNILIVFNFLTGEIVTGILVSPPVAQL